MIFWQCVAWIHEIHPLCENSESPFREISPNHLFRSLVMAVASRGFVEKNRLMFWVTDSPTTFSGFPQNFRTIATNYIPWGIHGARNIPDAKILCNHQPSGVFCHFVLLRQFFEVSIYTFGMKLVVQKSRKYGDSRKMESNFVNPKTPSKIGWIYSWCVKWLTLLYCSNPWYKQGKLPNFGMENMHMWAYTFQLFFSNKYSTQTS